jgi:heme exporter protein B
LIANEIKILLLKEIKLEWRQKFALNGIVLYLASTIFTVYLSVNVKIGVLAPQTWNALFWIIILFTAVNAMAKSFILENSGRMLYYYSICRPQSFILAKITYNSGLMIVLSSLGYLIFAIILNNPVKDIILFFINVTLASVAFATTLTMISAIAAKANNSHTLMTILSLPVIIPILLMVIRISGNAIAGMARSASSGDLLTLAALIVMVGSAAYILFPYLWRS